MMDAWVDRAALGKAMEHYWLTRPFGAEKIAWPNDLPATETSFRDRIAPYRGKE